jgi:hypothetical protein
VYLILRSKYWGQIVASVAVGTKARSEINSYLQRAQKQAKAYRAAREALLILDPEGKWKETYLELKDSDIRGPYAQDGIGDLLAHKGKNDRPRHFGGGHVETSWIWLIKAKNDDQVDHMRVQWSNLTAYADQFDEELIHVPEEMRRVLKTFQREAKEWIGRAEARSLPDRPLVAAGLRAYAHRQANYWEDRTRKFAARWLVLLKDHPDLDQAWTTSYLPMLDMTKISGRKVKIAKIIDVSIELYSMIQCL